MEKKCEICAHLSKDSTIDMCGSKYHVCLLGATLGPHNPKNGILIPNYIRVNLVLENYWCSEFAEK